MKQVDYLQKLLNGVDVEWKMLGDVAELKRGKTTTAKMVSKGSIPVISGGQNPAYYTGEANRSGEIITIAGSGAYAGYVMYWNEPIFISDAFSIQPNDKALTTKYLLYYLLKNQTKIYRMQKGSGVPHVYPKDLSKLIIPIPPLSVQKEIVRILDAFTELTNELTNELTMRQQQYNHYRDILLDFSDKDVEWKMLGTIGKVRMCKRILKSQTAAQGDIPFYKIGTFGKKADAYIPRELFYRYKNNFSYPKIGEILLSASGTIGRTVIFSGEESYFQDSNIVWIENDESLVLNKFLFYFYEIVDWNISECGTIKRLYSKNLEKIKIPIPSLEEQARIVAILDKFDTLTNSISEGLPREIELRQQQYEYYRELLLDFKKG